MHLKIYIWEKLVKIYVREFIFCFNYDLPLLPAEYLAKNYEVSRERQDEYAAQSQIKAEAAIKAGHFEMEITAVEKDKTSDVVLKDEFPRFGTTVDKLLKLKPCFVKKEELVRSNASILKDFYDKFFI